MLTNVKANDATVQLSLSATTSNSEKKPDISPSVGSFHELSLDDQVFTPDRKQKKKKKISNSSSGSATTINYNGNTVFEAAAQGNLPLCVLLWGIASARRANLMSCDPDGNNPVHFAATADNPEVLGFLLQQTKGYFSETTRLVDTRNRAGETPLLRAAASGVLSVIRALIDEGSDAFAADARGCSVFCAAARSGRLWALHLMLEHERGLRGVEAAQSLLGRLDGDGHSPLDWAADCGDVNVVELLLRRGFVADRRDASGRTALFWAAKSGRVEAARFLARCGCDPEQEDALGQSPAKLARSMGHRELCEALRHFDVSLRRRRSSPLPLADAVVVPVRDSAAACCYLSASRASHAIYRHNASRASHVMAYAALVFAVWMLSLVVPFYGWLLLLVGGLFAFRHLARWASAQFAEQDEARKTTALQELLSCPEKGLGLWAGSVAVYSVYLASSLFWAEEQHRAGRAYRVDGDLTIRMHDPLGVAGTDGEVDDKYLFWIVFCLFVLAVALWARLVCLDADPGRVDTRDADFEEILEQALLAGGTPSPQRFCRTTLVKKPIRSKFCRRMGFVVARMDHYCVWLNLTVGHRNHRTFVLFLLLHLCVAVFSTALIIRALHRELGTFVPTCGVVASLLGRRCFYTTTLCAFMVLVSAALSALAVEQLSNISRNLTANEKINRARYSYLMDDRGSPCNPFDRGFVGNWLEFWGAAGHAVDYGRLFELPSAATATGRPWKGTHAALPTGAVAADPALVFVCNPSSPCSPQSGGGGSAGRTCGAGRRLSIDSPIGRGAELTALRRRGPAEYAGPTDNIADVV